MISMQRADVERADRRTSMVAWLTTASAALTLILEYLRVPFLARATLFCVTGMLVCVLLFRLYGIIVASPYSAKLSSVRIHMFLHVVPLIFFGAYLGELTLPWMNLTLVVLFFLFFLSGRLAWRQLKALFPSTRLYHIFFLSNSAFMRSFPILYLLTLIIPDVITFTFIRNVALFYFSGHFLLFGLSCLKIESDFSGDAQCNVLEIADNLK
jgi:hypothetical protein